MDANPSLTAIKNTPKPPTKPPAVEFRSFAKLRERRVYLLDGYETNPNELDSQEMYDQKVAEFTLEVGEVSAKVKANQWRQETFGYGKEHGFFGEPVKPWFPGNLAVLIQPIKKCHADDYYNRTGETIDSSVAKILMALHKQFKFQEDPEKFPLEFDELGGLKLDGLGVMYGTFESARENIAAHLLSMFGKVVGQRPNGEYLLEPITKTEVEQAMPLHFLETPIGEGISVFDEILMVTTVFNPDLLKAEFEIAGLDEDDELKNSITSSPMNETQ